MKNYRRVDTLWKPLSHLRLFYAQELPKSNCVYVFYRCECIPVPRSNRYVYIMAVVFSGSALYCAFLGFSALSKGGQITAGELDAKELPTHACLSTGY